MDASFPVATLKWPELPRGPNYPALPYAVRANSCSRSATAICRCPDCPRLTALSALKSIRRLMVSLAPVSVIRSNAHRTHSVRDSGHARHYPEKRGGNCLPCLIASYALDPYIYLARQETAVATRMKSVILVSCNNIIELATQISGAAAA